MMKNMNVKQYDILSDEDILTLSNKLHMIE